MGAWSHEPFGNDGACDWSYELLQTSDLSVIESAFDKAIAEAAEYLDSSEAEEAIAAVEVLAKIKGQGTQSDAYTEEVDAWVSKHKLQPPDALFTKAKQVLELVTSEKSELLELWEGDDDWMSSIEKLKTVVSA